MRVVESFWHVFAWAFVCGVRLVRLFKRDREKQNERERERERERESEFRACILLVS